MQVIADIKGHQYLVRKGDILNVEKMRDKKEGDKVTVDAVLMTMDGDQVTVGTPHVPGASVELLVKKHDKYPKIRVVKFKAKKRYQRTQGHRQWYTQVEVTHV